MCVFMCRVTASSRDHEGTDHRDPRIGELSVQSEAEPVTIDSSTASEECSQSIVTPKVTVDHSERYFTSFLAEIM